MDDKDERLELVRFTSADAEPLLAVIRKSVPQRDAYAMAARNVPLATLIKHLLKLGACCAIVQNEVQDPDFTAEHAAYYSQLSQRVSKYCTRIHFFSADPETDDLLDAIDQFAEGENRYLGFLTLRPVRMSPIGASIVRVPAQDSGYFVLATDEFPVHLAGREFKVAGTPFMQQDSAVGACAQASIWMALRTQRSRAGHSAFNPAEITSVATRFFNNGRTYPSKGLAVTQITEAIRATGYAPHVLNLRDINQPADKDSLDHVTAQIYPYVESKIPVLLVLIPGDDVGHAVLAIGHGWTDSPQQLKPIKSAGNGSAQITAYDSANWVEPLVIHNDNSGPYQVLTRDTSHPYNLTQAVLAIPFLPPDVFLDGADAKNLALYLLEQCLTDLCQSQEVAKAVKSQVVLRTYLQDRATFRETVYSSLMPTDLKRHYRLKWLPKRVWVTEINALDGYGKSPSGGGRRLGEVVIDPTSTFEEASFLTIHLTPELIQINTNTGVVIDRDCKTGEINAFPVEQGAYRPLVRPRH